MNVGEEPEKPALELYGVDLTERARAGKLDPGTSFISIFDSSLD